MRNGVDECLAPVLYSIQEVKQSVNTEEVTVMRYREPNTKLWTEVLFRKLQTLLTIMAIIWGLIWTGILIGHAVYTVFAGL